MGFAHQWGMADVPAAIAARAVALRLAGDINSPETQRLREVNGIAYG
jgi:hypothetical protein